MSSEVWRKIENLKRKKNPIEANNVGCDYLKALYIRHLITPPAFSSRAPSLRPKRVLLFHLSLPSPPVETFKQARDIFFPLLYSLLSHRSFFNFDSFPHNSEEQFGAKTPFSNDPPKRSRSSGTCPGSEFCLFRSFHSRWSNTSV